MIKVSDLESLDRSDLAALWSEHMGGLVPASMSQPMQRRFLAHMLQVRQHGNLAPALAAKLDRIASGTERVATPGLKPGARLLRAWNGVTHVVDVEADGYRWNGSRHKSLSAIARAITGARWSGPQFFGLTETAKVESVGAAPSGKAKAGAAVATGSARARPLRRAAS